MNQIDRRGDDSDEPEGHDDVLMVWLREIEQILQGEEIDVVQHHEERDKTDAREDADVDQDVVRPRGNRLAVPKGPSGFNFPRRSDAKTRGSTNPAAPPRGQFDGNDDSRAAADTCVESFRNAATKFDRRS